MKAPVGLLSDRTVCDSRWRGLAPTSSQMYIHLHCLQEQRIVYTSALLADTVKPLNVLSKFENHFAIRTVRFQVQLEADGYFLLRRFLRLHPQQAGIQHKNALVSRLNDR